VISNLWESQQLGIYTRGFLKSQNGEDSSGREAAESKADLGSRGCEDNG
jgi:hypothetical protein